MSTMTRNVYIKIKFEVLSKIISVYHFFSHSVMYQIIMFFDGLYLSKIVKLKVTHPLRNEN